MFYLSLVSDIQLQVTHNCLFVNQCMEVWPSMLRDICWWHARSCCSCISVCPFFKVNQGLCCVLCTQWHDRHNKSVQELTQKNWNKVPSPCLNLELNLHKLFLCLTEANKFFFSFSFFFLVKILMLTNKYTLEESELLSVTDKKYQICNLADKMKHNDVSTL